MNPYDEQEVALLDEYGTKINTAKLKKLYTWYDIEKAKQERENELTCANGTAGDTFNALETERNAFHWAEFVLGLIVAFFLSGFILVILHNQ